MNTKTPNFSDYLFQNVNAPLFGLLTNTKTIFFKLRKINDKSFCCLFLCFTLRKLEELEKVIFNTTKGKI